jgi:DNA-directed RNA polymerase specialized sigma24 family protein
LPGPARPAPITGGAELRDLDREAAMVALFDAHHTQLVRLALLLGAEHDAEDIVSEAFCELHRRWRRLRSPGAAPAYLRSTVCNLARMRIRHLQVQRKHAHQEADGLAERTAESAEHSALLHGISNASSSRCSRCRHASGRLSCCDTGWT